MLGQILLLICAVGSSLATFAAFSKSEQRYSIGKYSNLFLTIATVCLIQGSSLFILAYVVFALIHLTIYFLDVLNINPLYNLNVRNSNRVCWKDVVDGKEKIFCDEGDELSWAQGEDVFMTEVSFKASKYVDLFETDFDRTVIVSKGEVELGFGENTTPIKLSKGGVCHIPKHQITSVKTNKASSLKLVCRR